MAAIQPFFKVQKKGTTVNFAIYLFYTHEDLQLKWMNWFDKVDKKSYSDLSLADYRALLIELFCLRHICNFNVFIQNFELWVYQ